jgi:hypothetical protein
MRAYLKKMPLWQKIEKSMAPRVFAVGLNKTATSSLGLAFQRLGYTLFEGPLEFHTAVQQALDERRHPLHYLKEYTAFEDIFIPGGYTGPHAERWASLEFREFLIRAMYKKYPRARFILNLREDLEGWVSSRKKHVEKNLKNPVYMAREYRWCEIRPDVWRREYAEQKELVRRLSRELGFPLLEFDSPAGDGYEKLCPFLNKPVPRSPFPNVNNTKKLAAINATD